MKPNESHFLEFTDLQKVTEQVYLHTLKSGLTSVTILRELLNGLSIAKTSEKLGVSFHAVAQLRKRHKDLINLYRKTGKLYFPKY